MKYFSALILGLFVIVVGTYAYLSSSQAPVEAVEDGPKQYTSTTFNISFNYPRSYFEQITSHEGERAQNVVTLFEDTQENRDVVGGKAPGREGPPTITIAMFQNDLDKYTTDSFIRNTSFSNFKLSDGIIASTTVAGEAAVRYHASGLYENENVVIARPDYVYMFTVSYLNPNDQIVKDFEDVLASVAFNGGSTPTSADNAPPGSIHNLPVPAAVAEAKKYAAEKLGVAEGLVIVMTAFEKEWSDSCLGLGGPTESCLQVMTPGWEITVVAKGTETVYRTNFDGTVIREER